MFLQSKELSFDVVFTLVWEKNIKTCMNEGTFMLMHVVFCFCFV